jgi:hypothetical protein
MTSAAAVRTTDRIDRWISQHVIPYCHGTYPSQSIWNPARNRRVGLLAIGQCLKDQYDALATPNPPASRCPRQATRNSRNGRPLGTPPGGLARGLRLLGFVPQPRGEHVVELDGIPDPARR